MTDSGRPPYRADHVGSLLRPGRLLKAREQHAAGEIDVEALRAVEDKAIREVVAMQRDVGLRTATDGEFRRASWHMDFIYQLDGVNKTQGEIKVPMRNEDGVVEFTSAAMAVDGKIGIDRPIFGEHFTFLKSAATGTGLTPKLTIPSPGMVHFRGGPAAIDRKVYPDDDEFWADLTAAYAKQLKMMADLGCTYLQLDDVSLAYLNDPRQRERVASWGLDAEHQHELYIRQINTVLAEKPASMTVTTHMCRGNYQSSWAAEGGYDYVADALFGRLDVDGFFLEYDDERSGTFEPLRFVPPGKKVVLGLVTTKRGELERKDDLKRRVEEASRYVPIEQICISPQCGFSSTVEGNRLSYEQQVAKLSLLVETAEEIW
ncbi:MAG TPA: 5-methyltetrahydropteroyltriglutamate--homocysteine S-methyltransferase [Jiangellaceae bacterium]|nr:5-methyltetrahydropteroyltriglutamate--homocysteine S-methyltransferase [Jiangellaceae bacterium]